MEEVGPAGSDKKMTQDPALRREPVLVDVARVVLLSFWPGSIFQRVKWTVKLHLSARE